MAAYISFQPTDFFNTKLYTGTAATLAVTGVGFQPDWIWLKSRSTTSNSGVYDSVRGVENGLASNLGSPPNTSDDGVEAFGVDGYTLGTNGNTNASGTTYVSWNWKAGTTSVPSGGSITPSAVSLNTTSKFGIYKWSGTGATSATIAHGLGAAPLFLIVKNISGTADWAVLPTNIYNDRRLSLNSNGTYSGGSDQFYDTTPTSTLFTLGSSTNTNASGSDYIAYAAAATRGFSSFGKYTGNGNINGPFVNTGFRPAWVVRKLIGTDSWMMCDNKRLGYNPDNAYLFADGTNAESDIERINFLSNGFKLRTTDGGDNGNGSVYLYWAFAEFPFVSSNSKAGTAR